jgi:hypothetical protein
MTSPPDWIRKQVLPILHQGKNVLAVEGDDDKDVYTAWLKKLVPRGAIISDKLVIVSVGDKMKVLNALEWQRSKPQPVSPEIYGLVDRDEWDAATIAVQCAADPRLLVNAGRHCLESYFTDPQEIAAALLAKDRRFYGAHIATLREQIESHRAARGDHWSLWVTMSRICRRLGEESFPGFFHDQYALPPDIEIKKRLKAWGAAVDSRTAFLAFDEERTRARGESQSIQLRSCVYAKKFYPIIVVQGVLNALGPSDGRGWMLKLAKWSPTVPQDLASLLKPLLR